MTSENEEITIAVTESVRRLMPQARIRSRLIDEPGDIWQVTIQTTPLDADVVEVIIEYFDHVQSHRGHGFEGVEDGGAARATWIVDRTMQLVERSDDGPDA